MLTSEEALTRFMDVVAIEEESAYWAGYYSGLVSSSTTPSGFAVQTSFSDIWHIGYEDAQGDRKLES